MMKIGYEERKMVKENSRVGSLVQSVIRVVYTCR